MSTSRSSARSTARERKARSSRPADRSQSTLRRDSHAPRASHTAERSSRARPARTHAPKVGACRYVDDARPGIARRRSGDGFVYFAPNGRRIRDAAVLTRIRALAIPPAWQDVWICPSPAGHIQASGRDARRRKQYRYHALWIAARDQAKYAHLITFAEHLPAIRRRVARDLRAPDLTREKVLAALVRVLDQTAIRIGNDEYARANDSYGLTTLKNRHVHISGARIAFSFKGKSGVRGETELEDETVAPIVEETRELPGSRLFEYVDETGRVRNVRSNDVNQYLTEIAGEPLTPKDFRTWTATLLAAGTLLGCGPADSAREAKLHLREAVEAAAAALGNSAPVCRKSYIHPAVLDGYAAGRLDTEKAPRSVRQLEQLVLEFLRNGRAP
jgi:DNA topoisomerase-1